MGQIDLRTKTCKTFFLLFKTDDIIYDRSLVRSELLHLVLQPVASVHEGEECCLHGLHTLPVSGDDDNEDGDDDNDDDYL